MIYLICRLEKIVFGDTSDIVNNLLDDKSDIKIKDGTVYEKAIDDNNDNEDSEDNKDNEELDHDISILNHSNNTKSEERKAAWIDEDDYNYT